MALTAAGCSHSAAQTTPTPTTTVAAPTTTQTTPDDTAIEQAQQTITAYWKVYNQVAQNPGADLTVINTVAAGQAAADVNSEIQTAKTKGLRGVGDVTIVSVKPTGVNIGGPAGKDADVTADVCHDVSKTQGFDAQGAPLPRQTMQMVDGNGQIVTVPWRDQRLDRFTVHNASWPDPTGWRVTQTESHNQPCS